MLLEAILEVAPHAQDFTHRTGCRNRPLAEADKAQKRTKSQVRAKVEHPLHALKRVFSFVTICYRELDKNAHRLFVAFGLVNLDMVRWRVVRVVRA